MVFLFHSSLLPYGYAGVDIFFVLSGFIIFWVRYKYIYPKHILSQKDTFFSFLTYFYHRFLRIYPTYWVFCGLFLGGIWAKGGNLSDFYAFNWWAFWQTFFLTPLHPTFLVVSWTLSYELYFYVLVGLLWVRIGGINIGFWVMCVVFLGSFTNFLNSFFLIKIIDFEQNELLNFFFSDIVLEFYLGILIFYVIYFQKITFSKYLYFTPFFIIINLILCYFCIRSRELYAGLPAFWVILGCVLLEKEKKDFVDFFKDNIFGKILVRLGGASYLLYISHSLLMGVFNNFLRKISFLQNLNEFTGFNATYLFQFFLIQIVILYVSEWIEQPFLKKMK